MTFMCFLHSCLFSFFAFLLTILSSVFYNKIPLFNKTAADRAVSVAAAASLCLPASLSAATLCNGCKWQHFLVQHWDCRPAGCGLSVTCQSVTGATDQDCGHRESVQLPLQCKTPKVDYAMVTGPYLVTIAACEGSHYLFTLPPPLHPPPFSRLEVVFILQII